MLAFKGEAASTIRADNETTFSEQNGASSLPVESEANSHDLLQSARNNSITGNAKIAKVEEGTPLADYVEKFCKVLFFVVYVVFNCAYWARYLNYPHSAGI